jgi:thiol-disulfide isomerase/thioredoxin
MKALLPALLAVCTILLATAARAQVSSPAPPPPPPPTTPAPKVLTVGDPAPDLSIATWVKGKPVEKLEPGKAYVVEFWATWCTPCMESIPHLTELQKKHKDTFTIIGISGADPRGESLDKVRKFVDKMGETMEYTIAFDDGTLTREAWMDAAEQAGIPTAFIVERTGRIAWIGNPLVPGAIDRVMEQIASGAFDLQKAISDARTAAEKRIAAKKIQKRLQDALEKNENTTVLACFDELYALDAKLFSGVPVYKFRYMLSMLKDEAGAYAYIRPFLTGDLKDQPAPLHEVAWIIATTEGLKDRDLDLALQAAKRAAEITENKTSEILDTLARVHYERNEFSKAVDAATKAVEVETDEVAKLEFKRNLERYQQSKKAGKKIVEEKPKVPR